MKAGDRWHCKCGTELIAAMTKAGKLAPVTLEVQVKGNVLLFKTTGNYGPVVECRTFAGAVLDKLIEEGVPRRLNHFADCPHAKDFESKKVDL